ncbi:craniofacial development protein 2-like [Artemia franciscana]|uniref:craniofacial development protein 2-like n=1 Tax=Artemia franciscana TaxID=6661 RepID=UPI0032D9B568
MRANLATAFPALSDASRLATSSKSELATILSRRQGLNIGCWNLCSIKCSLTQAFVAEEFYLYKLDIFCVSETRLNGQTKLDLIAPSGKKAILFNSGSMDGSGLGVGIIMTPKIASGLLDYEAVSDRIVMALLKGQSNSLTILSVYAPIRDAPDQLKDKLYADLQLTLNKIPRKDILVIGVDFNARIGTRLNDSERAIGNHGLGDRCINGVRLLMFAMLNNLSVLIYGLNTNLATLTLGDPEMVEPAPKLTIYSFLVGGSQ